MQVIKMQSIGKSLAFVVLALAVGSVLGCGSDTPAVSPNPATPEKPQEKTAAEKAEEMAEKHANDAFELHDKAYAEIKKQRDANANAKHLAVFVIAELHIKQADERIERSLEICKKHDLFELEERALLIKTALENLKGMIRDWKTLSDLERLK